MSELKIKEKNLQELFAEEDLKSRSKTLPELMLENIEITNLVSAFLKKNGSSHYGNDYGDEPIPFEDSDRFIFDRPRYTGLVSISDKFNKEYPEVNRISLLELAEAIQVWKDSGIGFSNTFLRIEAGDRPVAICNENIPVLLLIAPCMKDTDFPDDEDDEDWDDED